MEYATRENMLSGLNIPCGIWNTTYYIIPYHIKKTTILLVLKLSNNLIFNLTHRRTNIMLA